MRNVLRIRWHGIENFNDVKLGISSSPTRLKVQSRWPEPSEPGRLGAGFHTIPGTMKGRGDGDRNRQIDLRILENHSLKGKRHVLLKVRNA
jgi:hypothetical protein